MSSTTDLYKILDVPRNANEIEIKKAYRALSLKYHPDRNSDADAAELYKSINQAYEILSDEQKRQQYDMGGMDAVGQPEGMPNMNDINNIFNMMFGGGVGGGIPGMAFNMGSMGGMGGEMPEIHIFHGGMGGPFRQNMMKPKPLHKSISITLEQLYNGDTLPFEYECWTIQSNMRITEIKNVNITVPQGIGENEHMILQQMGNSLNENNVGDLIVGFDIAKHPLFDRNGMDLILHKKISLKEALCGFSFDIRHLNGKMLHMNNTANHTIIKPNFKKHIPNLGMIRNGQTGDLIIVFDIDFPDTLTNEQVDQLRLIL